MEVPELSGLDGAWLEPTSRSAAARRLAFTGDPAHADVWTHPFRLMRGLSTSGRIEASGAALELPLAAWRIAAEGGLASAEWTVDLRRAWPDSAGASGALAAALSRDAARLLVTAAAAPARALFAVTGGRLSVEEGGTGLRVRCEGSGELTLVAIGALDGADLDRTLDLLARRTLAGLARQRAQHDEQVARGGAALFTPDDESCAAAFEAAKLAADALLAESPGLGRAPLTRIAGDPHPRPGTYRTRDACRAALGLLAAGLREPARDTLRFLAGLANSAGSVPAEVSVGGVVAGERDAASAFLRLARGYVAWTGDAALVQELAPLARRSDLPPDPVGAESAGGPAGHLLQVVAGDWGVEPDAPGAAVRLAPRCPASGTRLGLSRLRIGRSVLDLRLRRRGATVQFSIRKVMGPPLGVTCEVRDVTAHAAELDGTALGAVPARFHAAGDHELILHVDA